MEAQLGPAPPDRGRCKFAKITRIQLQFFLFFIIIIIF